MELHNFLLILLVCLLMMTNKFALQSFAAKLCPVRARTVSTTEAEGRYKCVCGREFYGENCRFSGGNSSDLVMDASWKERNVVVVTWKTKMEAQLDDFQLYVRHVHYDNKKMPYYAKWRKFSVSSFKMINTTSESERQNARVVDGRTFAIELPLTTSFSYQLRLVMITKLSEQVTSHSVFVDGFEYLALDLKKVLKMSNNTKDNCRWYQCPGKFFHINQILEDFGKPCFKNGMTIGVPIGCMGMLLLFALIMVAPRATKQYKRRLRVRKQVLITNTKKKATPSVKITSKDERIEGGKAKERAMAGSVVIDLEEPSISNVWSATKICRLDTYHLGEGEGEVKSSTIFNIPETELIAPDPRQNESRSVMQWLNPVGVFKCILNHFTSGRKPGACQ